MSKKQKPSKKLENILIEAEKFIANTTLTEEQQLTIAGRLGKMLNDLTPEEVSVMDEVERSLLDKIGQFFLQDIIDPLLDWFRGGETPPGVEMAIKGIATLIGLL